MDFYSMTVVDHFLNHGLILGFYRTVRNHTVDYVCVIFTTRLIKNKHVIFVMSSVAPFYRRNIN